MNYYSLHERASHFAAAEGHTNTHVHHEGLDMYLEELDDLCNEETFNEPKVPLVLIGEPGSGKSSLLAKWVKNRREMKHPAGVNEFVFHHITGASRDSSFVANVLSRAVTEVKHHFGLQMEVSEKEQKLGWGLVRALDTASSKGRVILVIDGISRLQSTSFSGLKWLPLRFPPNVRVVISTTCSAADIDTSVAAIQKGSPKGKAAFITQFQETGSTKPSLPRDKALAEIVRRRWRVRPMSYLSVSARRKVVDAFLERRQREIEAAIAAQRAEAEESAMEFGDEGGRSRFGRPQSNLSTGSLHGGSLQHDGHQRNGHHVPSKEEIGTQ